MVDTMSGLMSCCIQRTFAGLLVVAGMFMSLEASTSSGHAVDCEPETFQPAYCKPPALYFNNSGLGCQYSNGVCAPPERSTVCEDQGFWTAIEPAWCVLGVTDSTIGVCIMGHVTTVVEIHYVRTVCQLSEGLCSCKGVALKDIVSQQTVCTCGDLVTP